MTATTYRADTKSRLVTILTAFSASYPDQIRRVHRARPESFPDLPAVYIDSIAEDISHSMQIRTRTLNGLAFVLVDRIPGNEQTALKFDQTVDLLVDWMSSYPQLGGTVGIWSRMRVSDEDAPFGDYDFAGVRFAFPDIDIEEGRP